jgi:hypothetical protein
MIDIEEKDIDYGSPAATFYPQEQPFAHCDAVHKALPV